jgi:Tol biopolymer transport system component
LADSDARQQSREWSTPVLIGNEISTASNDGCQFLSLDGKSLYVASNRTIEDVSQGGMDLYVSERNSTRDAFVTMVPLGPIVNSNKNDICPALSHDGHYLFFASERDGGCGNRDIYVAYRADIHDNFSWQTPRNLGCVADGGINTDKVEQGPSYYRDDQGNNYIYFSSDYNYDGQSEGGHDIWYFRVVNDAPSGAVLHEDALSSSANEYRPYIRFDGLEAVFDTDRIGDPQGGKDDIWTATRKNPDRPFTEPTWVTNVNTSFNERRATMNRIGSELYITSDRPGPGSQDVYLSTRRVEDEN